MKGHRKLGRPTAHRKAMLRNQTTDLLREGRITTTLTRAKETRRMAEKMITLGKRGDLHARRQALAYIYDESVVKGLQEKFPLYAENFPIWANQANGMLQFSIWSALREVNIGANLQHYNPVIDEAVKKLFGLPENWKLIAQMPFGGIVEEPAPKNKEDINERVIVVK